MVYRDEKGHFTNKENDGGQCKHKRINNGNHEYSEDGGKTWNAFKSVEDYDAYEAESEGFDLDSEDDFGFDEDNGPVDRYGNPIDIDNLDMYDDEDIYETDERGFVTLPKKLKPEIQQILDDKEYNTEMQKAQEENARLSEGEDGSELLTDNDMAQIKKYAERYEIPLDGLKQVIEEEAQKLIDNGASVTNAKNDAMESVLDDVVSRGNLESFLRGDKDKGNPYDPEKLPDEGMSQEELDNEIKGGSNEKLVNDYLDGKIDTKTFNSDFNNLSDEDKKVVQEMISKKLFGKLLDSNKNKSAAMNKPNDEIVIPVKKHKPTKNQAIYRKQQEEALAKVKVGQIYDDNNSLVEGPKSYEVVDINDDTITYKDKNGETKTMPKKDFASIVMFGKLRG